MFAKRNIFTTIALLIAAIVAPTIVSAQDIRLSESWQNDNRHGISVDFRVNSTVIDPNYHNNAEALERIDSLYRKLERDTTYEIVSVGFYGTASPEGSTEINYRLSRNRMLALEKMVRERIDIPEGIIIEDEHYIGWDHLIDLVVADTEMPMRDEVLKILNTEYPSTWGPNGRMVDGRITELRKLDNGRVWNLMLKRHFVHMRNAWVIIVTVRKVAEEEEAAKLLEQEAEEEELEGGSLAMPEPEPEPIPEPEPEPEPAPEPVERIGLISFKTNALEVAGLIANIGAEVRIAPKMSFDVIGHYSPYDYFKFDRKIRVFAIQPELRYWFGNPLVKGHFVGLHVPVTGFNVQLGDHRYQDPNRAAWGVGLSYGYALPLGKNTGWGVEFTVGLGYMNIVYDVYEGVFNGKYLRTETMNYWGPTRLGIDISYRIDYKKKNK